MVKKYHPIYMCVYSFSVLLRGATTQMLASELCIAFGNIAQEGLQHLERALN